MGNTIQPFSYQKKKLQGYANDSILEALRDLGSGVGKTITKDVVGKVGTDALSSLFSTIPKSGELKPNQPIELNRHEVQPTAFTRPEINHIKTAPLTETNLKQQIEAVRAELKALSISIKNLNLDVEKSIADTPLEVGVYHLTFLSRLRSILIILHQQIEDSRAWLALSTTRKKQKAYWGLYKKHGTKFGLSSERTMATQAG